MTIIERGERTTTICENAGKLREIAHRDYEKRPVLFASLFVQCDGYRDMSDARVVVRTEDMPILHASLRRAT